MSVPAQTLFEETKCYACYGLSAADLIKIGLLNRILSGESSPVVGAQPLVYRALLSQSGVNAPTATVLENTLGGSPVWTRTGPGNYFITLAGVFVQSKTYFSIVASLDPGSTTSQAGATSVNNNQIFVGTGDPTTATNLDDILSGTPFEILVYP